MTRPKMQPDKIAQPETAAGAEIPKTEILVVEDDGEIAYLLTFLLEREGFQVHSAADGREANHLIETLDPPGIVLLDVQLPYIDGFQLIKRIRARSGWEGVPIIMLTSKSAEPDIVRALDSGADDYVVKPFQPNELTARLRRHLSA